MFLDQLSILLEMYFSMDFLAVLSWNDNSFDVTIFESLSVSERCLGKPCWSVLIASSYVYYQTSVHSCKSGILSVHKRKKHQIKDPIIYCRKYFFSFGKHPVLKLATTQSHMKL